MAGAALGAGRRLLTAAAVAAGLIGLWQLTLVIWPEIPEYLLPQPHTVLEAFTASPQLFLSNVAVTTSEIALGLGLGIVGALVWAVALMSFRPLRRAVFPLLVAAQSAPKEALAPIFIIWWGFSPLPKVVMAALISFFPMLIATMVGLERFSEQQRLLAASMGAGPVRTLLSFRVWAALPSFLSGIRLGVTLAAIGAVLAEYLGSDRGVGYQILGASRRLDGGLLYASLIALVLLSWALVRLVDLLEAWLLHGSRRGGYGH
ncbi:MAG TPA: ABC transporter permease [Actinomycetes bacterium]|nr:ABC transporter permease [Actinomycetes bacterium]